jgi:hypothetical protein
MANIFIVESNRLLRETLVWLFATRVDLYVVGGGPIFFIYSGGHPRGER